MKVGSDSSRSPTAAYRLASTGTVGLTLRAFVIAALLLVLGAETSRAEFPLAFQLAAGSGMGSGHRGRGFTGPAALSANAEVIYRQAPGKGLVLTALGGLVGHAGGSVELMQPNVEPLDDLGHTALLVSVERAATGDRFGPYLDLGVGVGRLMADDEDWEQGRTGVAFGATLGNRFVWHPGPLGFVLGLHTSHVLASGRSSHLVALTIGFTMYPLAPDGPADSVEAMR